ncbi:MAG TPA: NnrS family protein, partial [Methylothermaceae bacterium]|nr:NnrS family protein [Methylothermaceae bacterium]
MAIALFNLGFRPFFLLGSAYGAIAMGLWIGPYFPHALAWHAHEMIYGFAAAIIAGFLLTAVCNWTGLATLEGSPLAALVCLWLSARLLSLNGSVPALAAWLDLVFLTCLLAAVARPIWQVRQWRQWGVLTCVAFLILGQAAQVAAIQGWTDDTRLGVQIGLYAVLGLILIIARRVIPFFTERGVNYPVSLRQFPWTDRWAMPLYGLYAGLAVLTPH